MNWNVTLNKDCVVIVTVSRQPEQSPILPEASFGLRVLSLPASVCVCPSVCLSVCVSITCLSAR